MDHGEPAGNTGSDTEFESEESATVERTDRSAEGDQLKGSELEEPLRTPRPKLADSTTADTIRTDVASGAESFATQLAGGPSSDPPDVSGYADILNSMKAKKRKAEESDELDDDLKPAAAQSRVASPTATNFKPIAPSPTVALENLGASDDAAPKNDEDYLSEGNKGALPSSSDDDAPHPDGFRAPRPIEALIGKLALEFEPYSTKVEIRELLLSEEMRAITDVKVMDEVASNILISRASQKMMDAYPDYDGGIL